MSFIIEKPISDSKQLPNSIHMENLMKMITTNDNSLLNECDAELIPLIKNNILKINNATSHNIQNIITENENKKKYHYQTSLKIWELLKSSFIKSAIQEKKNSFKISISGDYRDGSKPSVEKWICCNYEKYEIIELFKSQITQKGWNLKIDNISEYRYSSDCDGGYYGGNELIIVIE